ncbi:IMP dehydrogenase [Spiroplasma endosymbiont of Labia minor]|uniref:IMP dehydrogenase n=1 Tax=Spiroplasma endosymbiont of Labia minor TaxID=3066305 RepID=UPI0030D30990
MKNDLNGKLIMEGITFDDVLLIPAKSDVLPDQADLKAKLTKNITLNVPILSSAMDTITESKLAIALARVGGAGVIHKNLTIAEQALEVEKVKRNEAGFIIDPIVVSKDETIKKTKEKMNFYNISGLPVVDDKGILLGIITSRDIKYAHEMNYLVENVMIKENLITGHENISLAEANKKMLSNRVEKLPIVDGKNKLVGLITTKDIENKLTYPNACKDKNGRLVVGAAVGIGKDTLSRVEALINAGVDFIVVDSAHGHSTGIINTVSNIRKQYPDLDIIAGNIVTAAAAEDLYQAGANSVKVGIGSGSICTTRIIAGVGVPQISAINEVYEWGKDKNVTIIADGGIKQTGDIVKAIAAGANLVMLGNFFAGTEETPGEEVIVNGKKYKTYVGMGSLAAMKRGSSDRYFQTGAKKLVPEGIEARVPFKGSVAEIVFQIIGGLKSGMGYTGSKNIENLRTNAKFIKITNAGLVESHPHDVEITREAPNYSN